MSLRWYRTPKLVVFDPSAPVRDVARAIEGNLVGAIVIQEHGRVIGIVTDRDLTTRVVGAGLDPKATPVGTVMTSPVATLPPSAAQADALALMRQRSIRRIPLLAQLPSLLQPRLLALPPGPDKLITRQWVETELSRRLDVGPQRAAQILNGIGASISESVTPGQIDDVRGQLPDELRSILPSQSAGLPEAHPEL